MTAEVTSFSIVLIVLCKGNCFGAAGGFFPIHIYILKVFLDWLFDPNERLYSILSVRTASLNTKRSYTCTGENVHHNLSQ